MSMLLIAHEAACALLFFSVFCRLTKTHHGTLLGIRFAFFVLGVVAATGMAWPILGWPLSWFSVLLALAIVLVQLVTSHYWAHGAPWQFDYKRDRRA